MPLLLGEYLIIEGLRRNDPGRIADGLMLAMSGGATFGPGLGAGPRAGGPLAGAVRGGGGLADLAKFRGELGINASEGTLARLDVGGRSFYGLNAHGQPLAPLRVNPTSATHAEADAFAQAARAGANGGTGTLVLNDPVNLVDPTGYQAGSGPDFGNCQLGVVPPIEGGGGIQSGSGSTAWGSVPQKTDWGEFQSLPPPPIRASSIDGAQSSSAAGGVAPSSRALGCALESAGHVRPPGAAAHHIVPGAAEKVGPARAALERFGIGINDAANGVYLQSIGHARIHTNAYYSAVNKALGRATTREEALRALDTIRQGLLSGEFP